MNFSCLSNQFKKEECRSLDNIFFFTTIILCVVIICLCIVCLCINCCCCYCFLRRRILDNRPRTCKIYKNINCTREKLNKTQTTQTERARYSTVNNNNNNIIINDNGYILYDYIEKNGLFSLRPTSSHYYESIH